ncbi:MAG: manganese efflux pump [Fibrobacteres bacterium]|nr:manganese efflux pump [Fibrobacterota bacterium]
MGIISIILIGVGLSMDAFAVSLTACINWEGHRIRNALKIAFFFGFFQALMPTIGYFGGTAVSGFVQAVDHWIAFALLLIVGGKMIVEAIRKSGEGECKKEKLTIHVLLMLALATSIDAFAVGLTFAMLKTAIWLPVVLIGLTTFIISFVGVIFGEKIGEMAGRKVEVLGGLLLVGIGVKILVTSIA